MNDMLYLFRYHCYILKINKLYYPCNECNVFLNLEKSIYIYAKNMKMFEDKRLRVLKKQQGIFF